MPLGRIFDIQRFSVHDGPGIRTTVFMKGCPLRCRWCHNPEGLSGMRELQYFGEKCIGCGRCGTKSSLDDAKKCPADALKICGRDISVPGVVAEIKKDVIFYADCGGVTFSGGECLLQADFVAETLTEIKKIGLHTAIDTSGYVPWESIEKTLDCCDLYLYDIKCIDQEKHKEYTGVDNALIIENFNKLCAAGKDIWVRVPVIPDFNDTADEMSKIAELVAGLDSVKQVTLMPYHTLGASKYPTLGLEYQYDIKKKVGEEKMACFCREFEKRNVALK